jgi:hypothetical protein
VTPYPRAHPQTPGRLTLRRMCTHPTHVPTHSCCQPTCYRRPPATTAARQMPPLLLPASHPHHHRLKEAPGQCVLKEDTSRHNTGWRSPCPSPVEGGATHCRLKEALPEAGQRTTCAGFGAPGHHHTKPVARRCPKLPARQPIVSRPVPSSAELIVSAGRPPPLFSPSW